MQDKKEKVKTYKEIAILMIGILIFGFFLEIGKIAIKNHTFTYNSYQNYKKAETLIKKTYTKKEYQKFKLKSASERNDIIKNTPLLEPNKPSYIKELKSISQIDPNKKYLIIVYKFMCKDCEKAYLYLKNKIASSSKKNNIYFIASKSNTGKEILNNYPIKFVPSSIIIKPNQQAEINVLYNKKGTNKKLIDDIFKEYERN